MSFLQSKLELSNGDIYTEVIKPRGEGIFGSVYTSFEYYSVSRLTYNQSNNHQVNGVPDVWRINAESYKLPNGKGKPDFVELTSDIEHWIFRLNVEKLLGGKFKTDAEYMDYWSKLKGTSKVIQDFKSLLKGDRSHTNEFGSDTNRSYVCKSHSEEPNMKFFQLITGRCVVKLKSLNTRRIRGENCYEIECINMSKGNHKSIDPKEKFWLFDEPIISGRQKILDSKGYWTGKYKEDIIVPYGHFAPTRPIFPIMLPYDDTAWINANLVKVLDDYNPTPSKYKIH